MKTGSKAAQVGAYYRTLSSAWGPQHWWPGRTRFEVICGAYLVQNTAWTNVERALRRLRAAGALSLDGIRRTPPPKLGALIRPAGYFRQKSRNLKAFVRFLDERYDGSLHRMFLQPTEQLRRELLSLDGVGPETADSILLYAGQRPVFVVDTYARRILDRHGVLPANIKYEEARDLLERALAPVAGAAFGTQAGHASPPTSNPGTSFRGPAHPPSPMSLVKRSPLAQVYNEMHGLIVGVGKQYCGKTQPRCEECPLRGFLPRR